MGIVIDKRPVPAAAWQAVIIRPDVPPPEGTPIDDLVAEFEADGLDVKGARRDMGGQLAEAGNFSLRTLRLKAGLSQRELAERIGTSQPNVARLEKAPGDPTLGTLRRLADALGVDFNTLIRALP